MTSLGAVYGVRFASAAPASSPAAGRPAAAPPVDAFTPGATCTPEVKEQIRKLLASANMEHDSGTLAYAMGLLVGVGAGAVLWGVHPLLGIAGGAAVFAGGFALGRAADRSARCLADEAIQLNKQHGCFPEEEISGR